MKTKLIRLRVKGSILSVRLVNLHESPEMKLRRSKQMLAPPLERIDGGHFQFAAESIVSLF
jgi:hypothetical protein